MSDFIAVGVFILGLGIGVFITLIFQEIGKEYTYKEAQSIFSERQRNAMKIGLKFLKNGGY